MCWDTEIMDSFSWICGYGKHTLIYERSSWISRCLSVSWYPQCSICTRTALCKVCGMLSASTPNLLQSQETMSFRPRLAVKLWLACALTALFSSFYPESQKKHCWPRQNASLGWLLSDGGRWRPWNWSDAFDCPTRFNSRLFFHRHWIVLPSESQRSFAILKQWTNASLP